MIPAEIVVVKIEIIYCININLKQSGFELSLRKQMGILYYPPSMPSCKDEILVTTRLPPDAVLQGEDIGRIRSKI